MSVRIYREAAVMGVGVKIDGDAVGTAIVEDWRASGGGLVEWDAGVGDR